MLEKSISEQVSQYWIIVQFQDCFRQTRGQKSLPLDKSHYHCTVVSRALINSQLIGSEKTIGHGGKTADHFPCPNRSKWIKYLMSHQITAQWLMFFNFNCVIETKFEFSYFYLPELMFFKFWDKKNGFKSFLKESCYLITSNFEMFMLLYDDCKIVFQQNILITIIDLKKYV